MATMYPDGYDVDNHPGLRCVYHTQAAPNGVHPQYLPLQAGTLGLPRPGIVPPPRATQGSPPRSLTFTRNYTRRVRVESRVGPLPTDLADGAIRDRAFSIRGGHRFCAPDSLPTGQSFSNTARSSFPQPLLPSSPQPGEPASWQQPPTLPHQSSADHAPAPPTSPPPQHQL